jgi:hypothetical protein
LLVDFFVVVERFPAFFEPESTTRALTFTRRCFLGFGDGVEPLPVWTQPPAVLGRGLTNVTLLVPGFRRVVLRTSKPLAIGRPASVKEQQKASVAVLRGGDWLDEARRVYERPQYYVKY